MKEKRCQVITVANHKGGVGKSTITFNLGAGLAEKGYRVLLIDFDGQANLTMFSGVAGVKKTVATDLFKFSFGEAFDYPIHTVRENLDILPNNLLHEKWKKYATSESGSMSILRTYIASIKDRYDYDLIFIDNHNSMDIGLYNSVMASDKVLLVGDPTLDSAAGFSTIVDLMNEIEEHEHHRTECAGIILNRYEAGTTLHKTMIPAIRETWRGIYRVYDNIVPKATALGRGNLAGLTIEEMDKNSKAAEAIRGIVDEFIEEINKEPAA